MEGGKAAMAHQRATRVVLGVGTLVSGERARGEVKNRGALLVIGARENKTDTRTHTPGRAPLPHVRRKRNETVGGAAKIARPEGPPCESGSCSVRGGHMTLHSVRA